MDGPDPSALREEYHELVLDTIRRYLADGHALSIETTRRDGAVSVAFTFDPEAFGDYFAQMGMGEVTSDIPAPPSK